MKTITIKNLTIQLDIPKLHGNGVADAQTAIDLINLALQNEPNGMGAQILSSSIDASDVEIGGDEIEKDDDGNCKYCGQKCFEGEMCDEQQAGGHNK